MRKIVMGTRGSVLAVAQAETVKKMLIEKIPGLTVEIKKIVTSGDRDQTTNWGGDSSLKSMFVKEIERELLEGTIDFAVHSMKDMPQISPEGLINACFPIREDNRDVLVSKNNTVFSKMPSGSVIGTSSLRRKSAVTELYPEMEIKPIRGNIHTRLGKLDSGEYDGIILAAAGLIRTGLESRISEYIDPEKMPPAPAQGILCVQCRENNMEILEISYRNKTEEAIFEALFKNMNYKVLQTKKESDELTIVKVEVENVDIKGVFMRLFEETMKDMSAGGEGSKADDHSSLEKKLIEILNDKNVPKIKAVTEFAVYNTKEGNKIELTPDNVNIMFGQISSLGGFAKSDETTEEKKTEPEDIQPKPQPMQKK